MAEENAQELEQAQTIEHTSTEHVSARSVQLHQASANIIHADKDVTIRQGVAKEIRAQDVTIRQGGAITIDADNVHLTQGAVGLVRAGDAELGPGSSSVAVLADSVHLDQASAQFVMARDSVELDQCATGILVGQHITAKDSVAMLMFADKVEGNVSVVMDRQMAITFGAALGAALGLVLGLFGILRRKK